MYYASLHRVYQLSNTCTCTSALGHKWHECVSIQSIISKHTYMYMTLYTCIFSPHCVYIIIIHCISELQTLNDTAGQWENSQLGIGLPSESDHGHNRQSTRGRETVPVCGSGDGDCGTLHPVCGLCHLLLPNLLRLPQGAQDSRRLLKHFVTFYALSISPCTFLRVNVYSTCVMIFYTCIVPCKVIYLYLYNTVTLYIKLYVKQFKVYTCTIMYVSKVTCKTISIMKHIALHAHHIITVVLV